MLLTQCTRERARAPEVTTGHDDTGPATEDVAKGTAGTRLIYPLAYMMLGAWMASFWWAVYFVLASP